MRMGEHGGYLVRIYPVALNEGILSLPEKTFCMGRDKECEMVLDDQDVSRRHASIEMTPEGYTISDLGSTNGTVVNEAKVKRAVLASGDLIRLGTTILKFLRGNGVEKNYYETVYSMMVTDGLTGVSNKRFFEEVIDRELSRSQRHNRPLSLAILDIDHFKKVNDTHGHLAGDAVLRELCRRMRGAIRRDEVFARYGGEEFVLLLPESTLEQACPFGARILKLISGTPFQLESGPIDVTVSIGIAYTKGGEAVSRAELIERADKKLYEAKNSGRNRVVW